MACPPHKSRDKGAVSNPIAPRHREKTEKSSRRRVASLSVLLSTGAVFLQPTGRHTGSALNQNDHHEGNLVNHRNFFGGEGALAFKMEKAYQKANYKGNHSEMSSVQLDQESQQESNQASHQQPQYGQSDRQSNKEVPDQRTYTGGKYNFQALQQNAQQNALGNPNRELQKPSSRNVNTVLNTYDESDLTSLFDTFQKADGTFGFKVNHTEKAKRHMSPAHMAPLFQAKSKQINEKNRRIIAELIRRKEENIKRLLAKATGKTKKEAENWVVLKQNDQGLWESIFDAFDDEIKSKKETNRHIGGQEKSKIVTSKRGKEYQIQKQLDFANKDENRLVEDFAKSNLGGETSNGKLMVKQDTHSEQNNKIQKKTKPVQATKLDWENPRVVANNVGMIQIKVLGDWDDMEDDLKALAFRNKIEKNV